MKKCPICKKQSCNIYSSKFYTTVNCKTFKLNFLVNDSIIDCNDVVKKRKMFNLILDRLIRKPICTNSRNWQYIYNEEKIGQLNHDAYIINIANDMLDYPNDFMDKIDRVLLNLSIKYNSFDKIIDIISENSCLFYCETDSVLSEINKIINFLEELTYVKRNSSGYYISAEGWKRINTLRKKEKEINQCFIAMEFSSRTDNIREILKNAIKECRYEPRIMDEKEHNNQIIPEMFYEISRSKFTIVDVTYPNFGAYYEAGYAQALGKQVIVCCRADIFNSKNRPHFDISQKAMVIWENDNELKEKLVKRIEATVGKVL